MALNGCIIYFSMETKEHTPKEFEDKPELELAWRGLVISISAGVMTRRRAFEMVKGWENQEHLHDVDADGIAAG